MIEPPENAEPPGTAPGPESKVTRRLISLVPVFALLLFLGAMFWAKSQDPFSRRWFTLKTDAHSSFNCVAVLPKPVHRYPVIVYAHGAGDSLMEDGNDLRQMAELGVATVSLDYNQTNSTIFAAQWTALLRYLGRQKWADTNAIAWVGFSLGANEVLEFALQHPEQSPRLLVQISGAGLSEGEAGGRLAALRPPALLVHGDQDEIFPIAGTQRFADSMQTNGQSVVLHIIPGIPHDLAPERSVVIRGIGEYCLTHLTGPDAWRHYHSIAQWQAEAPPLCLFFVPALVLAGLLMWRRVRASQPVDKNPLSNVTTENFFVFQRIGRLFRVARCAPVTGGGMAATPSLSRSELVLRWLAVVLAALAIAETALHLVPPYFAVSPTTLSLARRILVQPKESADFEYLAARPVWAGAKLKMLLDHVQLAGYNRQLVNWTVDDKMYQDGVLSPVITGHPGEWLNWRRPLWEEFYPRIRREGSLAEAARIIVRHLRERVTIATVPGLPREVPDIWRRQITDETGFALIYVAALRSAGVPARLDSSASAEFWNGDKWQIAPRPVIVSW